MLSRVYRGSTTKFQFSFSYDFLRTIEMELQEINLLFLILRHLKAFQTNKHSALLNEMFSNET